MIRWCRLHSMVCQCRQHLYTDLGELSFQSTHIHQCYFPEIVLPNELIYISMSLVHNQYNEQYLSSTIHDQFAVVPNGGLLVLLWDQHYIMLGRWLVDNQYPEPPNLIPSLLQGQHNQVLLICYY